MFLSEADLFVLIRMCVMIGKGRHGSVGLFRKKIDASVVLMCDMQGALRVRGAIFIHFKF